MRNAIFVFTPEFLSSFAGQHCALPRIKLRPHYVINESESACESPISHHQRRHSAHKGSTERIVIN